MPYLGNFFGSSGVVGAPWFLQVERSSGNFVISLLQKGLQILTDSCRKCLRADLVL